MPTARRVLSLATSFSFIGSGIVVAQGVAMGDQWLIKIIGEVAAAALISYGAIRTQLNRAVEDLRNKQEKELAEATEREFRASIAFLTRELEVERDERKRECDILRLSIANRARQDL